MDETKFAEWWDQIVASFPPKPNIGDLTGPELIQAMRSWARAGWAAAEDRLPVVRTEDPEIAVATGGTMPLSKVREMLNGP